MSLYTKNRKRVTDALVRDDGFSVIEAQRIAQEWEFEANRRGLNGADPLFWRLGREWMTTERQAQTDGANGPGLATEST